MDIIQEAIESQFGKNVLILNGDFSEKERQDVLSTFKQSNTHNIMIINYKLGSEGLNLMEANNVILCENWWCPSVMEQAKHRAYRIGQKRKVYIYNIITKNTIEEKIKKICDKKEDLSKSFMNDVFDTFKQKDYKLNSSTLKRIIF
jgi:SNF2 family DNA or RNA helicase